MAKKEVKPEKEAVLPLRGDQLKVMQERAAIRVPVDVEAMNRETEADVERVMKEGGPRVGKGDVA